MKSKYLIILIIALIGLTLFACSSKEEGSSPTYSKISAEQAKGMMDEDSTVIILDVRTEEEHNSGHIEGSLLIPNTQLSEKASEILTDKSATILVYCRSGNRSASASKELVDAGYTNVYDFGGINDWNYEIVTK